MRTMYHVEVGIYGGGEYIRNTHWEKQDGLFHTIEEAKDFGATFKWDNMHYEGSFRIIEDTMDEATFTYKEKEVYLFNHFDRVRYPQYLEKDITILQTEIEELQGKIERAHSENSIIKYTKKIEKVKNELAEKTEQLEKHMKKLEMVD